MTLKTLVTGVAAVAVVAAAAGGVTSIASSASPTTPAIQPVVFGAPLPLDAAPDLAAPLQQTVNALGSGGSFSSKSAYLEPLGTAFRIGAERKYNSAVSKGYFPLTSTVANVDLNGAVATADVTATSSNGSTAGPVPLTFAQNPASPTGWVLTTQSLLTLSSAMG